MSRTRLTELPRPFIVDVVTDRSPAAAIATMLAARIDGAHAHELNLPALVGVSAEELRSIFAGPGQPVYTSCRRTEFMTVYGIPRDELPDWDDGERMARQLAALELGAVALDMELDAFDPRPAPPLGTPEAEQFARASGPPAEVSTAPDAVASQREVIAAAQAAGGEVILSCHTGRLQSAADLVVLAELARERGADLVKIVTPCLVLTDLLAVFEATVMLRSRLSIPVTIVGAGAVGQLSRSLAAHFGAGWAIGQQRLVPGGFLPQPLVASLREVLRLLPWRFESEGLCV